MAHVSRLWSVLDKLQILRGDLIASKSLDERLWLTPLRQNPFRRFDRHLALGTAVLTAAFAYGHDPVVGAGWRLLAVPWFPSVGVGYEAAARAPKPGPAMPAQC